MEPVHRKIEGLASGTVNESGLEEAEAKSEMPAYFSVFEGKYQARTTIYLSLLILFLT